MGDRARRRGCHRVFAAAALTAAALGMVACGGSGGTAEKVASTSVSTRPATTTTTTIPALAAVCPEDLRTLPKDPPLGMTFETVPRPATPGYTTEEVDEVLAWFGYCGQYLLDEMGTGIEAIAEAARNDPERLYRACRSFVDTAVKARGAPVPHPALDATYQAALDEYEAGGRACLSVVSLLDKDFDHPADPKEAARLMREAVGRGDQALQELMAVISDMMA